MVGCKSDAKAGYVVVGLVRWTAIMQTLTAAMQKTLLTCSSLVISQVQEHPCRYCIIRNK